MASLQKVSWAAALIVAVAASLIAGIVAPVSATTRPSAPTNLAAAMATEVVAVELTWNGPTNVVALGYNITRNGAHYRSVVEPVLIDTEVEVGATYTYAVSAWAGPPADREYSAQSEPAEITVTNPADSNGGAPGPQMPTGLTAVARSADQNGGIEVSWSDGGGAVPTVGYNINRNDQYLGSLVGSTSFLDTKVEAGVAYSYAVSAWAEGPLFSATTGEVSATALATPPPGTPGGLPEPPPPPAIDPLFDDNPRDKTAAPPLPQQVRIEAGRLVWEMPKGPRWLFQLTRNSTSESADDHLWARKQVTPGHPDLQYWPIAGEWVLFSFPLDERFKPGDHFLVEAIHPYEFTDVADNVRSSTGSRVATVAPAPGSAAAEIGDFLSAFGTATAPSDPWIGSRSDWQDVPQFADDFEGSGQLVDRSTLPWGSWLDDADTADLTGPGWYFARNDTAEGSLTPAFTRDQTQSDRQTELRDGKLEMTVDLVDGSYPYIGTTSNGGDGYLIDPSNGVFVDVSVRLDQSTPADNAWWSFWLMAPGGDSCVDGKMVRGALNPYDGFPATGTEVDIFELVPDTNNGFNQAAFRWEDGQAPGCFDPGDDRIGPGDRDFSFWAGSSQPGVDVPQYMDGDYHRLGMYYAPDCYAFYIDNELIWQVSEADRPGWVTPTKSEAIRMTWELQNPRQVGDHRISSPWTGHGGSTKTTARTTDPKVFVDFVKVWEKKPDATGHCGGVDPTTPPDYYQGSVPPPVVLEAPTNVQAAADGEDITITWEPASGPAADGWDISRGGEGYWTVTEPTFTDPHTVDGETYFYAVTPWIERHGGPRKYGPTSEPVSITKGSGPVDPGGPGDPTVPAIDNTYSSLGGATVRLTWDHVSGEGLPAPDGYRVIRSGNAPIIEEFVAESWYIDNNNPRAMISYRYEISAHVGPPEDRRFGPPTTVVVKNLATVAPSEVHNFRAEEHVGLFSVLLNWDHPDLDGDFHRGSAVSGYRILRDGEEIAIVKDTRPGASPNNGGSLSRTYRDEDAERRKTHIYTIIPFQGDADEGLNGPPTSDVSGPPLTPVKGLSVAQTRFAQELVLTWEPPANGPRPSGYNIERNGQFVASVSSPTYVDRAVSVANTYSYVVVPYWSDGSVILGPRASAVRITVSPVADAITAESPNDIKVRERIRTDQNNVVEVTWSAPPGWDRGLIDSYDVFRNGEIIGTLDEPDFGNRLPSSQRTFVDENALLGIPSAYKVRARSLGDGSDISLVGELSSVAVIQPRGRGFYGDAVNIIGAPKQTPKSFLRAVETVVGVSGLDAGRLGGELFTIYRLNEDHPGRDYKQLLRSFNDSLREFGHRELMVPAATLDGSSSAEVGHQLFEAVASQASREDLLSILPGYEPAGAQAIREFGYPLSTATVAERANTIKIRSGELEQALERVNPNNPSERQLYNVAWYASHVVIASLGLDTDERQGTSRLSSIIKNGYYPTGRQPIPNCGGRDEDTHNACVRFVPRPTDASRLFNAATEAERAEFFGISPSAYEFSKPFQDIADNAHEMRRKIKNAKIRRWIGVVFGVIFSIALLNADLGFFATMALSAGGSYVSTVIATGSTAAAEKRAINGLFSSAVQHYEGIANLRGWGILVEGTLHAALAEYNDEDPEEAFLAAVAGRFLQNELAESEWLKLKPHLSAVVAMVIEAVVSGNIRDWDDFVDHFEEQLYDEVGGRIGNFVGAQLPSSWGNVGDALGDLVGHGIVSESRIAAGADSEQMRAELREHFYDKTLPVLAQSTGTALTDALGDGDPEEFFASIVGDIGQMIVLSLDPNFDLEERFEQFVYAQAGRFAEEMVGAWLVEANDGQSTRLTEALSQAIGLAIRYSYDEDKRREQLQVHALDYVTAALADTLPADCDSDRIGQLSSNLLNTLIDSDSTESFEANAEALVGEGVLLGTAVSESCGDPGDPTDPQCPAGDGRSFIEQVVLDAPSCPVEGGVDGFRNWLIRMNSITVVGELSITPEGGNERIRGLREYPGYSLFVVGDKGSISRDGETITVARALDVARNTRGEIVGFYDFGELIDRLPDRTPLDALLSAASGCGESLGETLSEITETFVEIVTAESIGAYLAARWEEFTQIRDAFLHNPPLFFQEFLEDLIRLEDLGEDSFRWAGLIVCDIAAGAARVGVSGRFSDLFARARNGEFNVWIQENDNDSSGTIRPCRRNSFPTGTPVLMADGSRRPIESVRPGDLVLAADETTGVWSARPVLDQWSHLDHGEMVTVTLADGSEVSATDDHRFWVAGDGSWIELEDVKPDDLLLTPDGVTRVASVEVSPPKETLVWELDVAVDDTFAVSTGSRDVLVHNGGRCDPSFAAIEDMLDEYNLRELATKEEVLETWQQYAEKYADVEDLDSTLWLQRYGNVRNIHRDGRAFEVAGLSYMGVPGTKLMYTDDSGVDFIPDHAEELGDNFYFVEVKGYIETGLDVNTNVGTMLHFLIEQTGDRKFDLVITQGTVISPRLVQLIDEAVEAGVAVEVIPVNLP